jgi:hypothetical protein
VIVSALLDRGPHTVTIYLEEVTTDTYGNPVRRASDVGVLVTGCLLTPLASDRDAVTQTSSEAGQREDRTWRFRAREAPLEPWGRVVWHDGVVERRMTVLSGPLRYSYSAATAHVAATLHEEN